MNSLKTEELLKNRASNLFATVFLLTALVGMLGVFAYPLFGILGLLAVFISFIAFILFGSSVSSGLVLKLKKAVPIPITESRSLYLTARELAASANISSDVELFLTPELAPNAFATGSEKKPQIALSLGLLKTLNHRELVAVIGHEIAHIANGDMKIQLFGRLIGKIFSSLMLWAQILVLLNLPWILAGYFYVPFWFLAALFLAPTMIHLTQLKLSRIREFDADALAVQLTKDPAGLTNALTKLGNINKSIFANVLSSSMEAPEWLSTHPKLSKRIKRIKEMQSCPEYSHPLFGSGVRPHGIFVGW